jgi:uncharacterized membrane protein
MKQKVGMDEMRQQVEREAPVVAIVFAVIAIIMTIVLFPKLYELQKRYHNMHIHEQGNGGK